MIFNTVVMLGTRSILMQTKINFQITGKAKSSRDLIAGFIDELILNYSIDAKAVSLLGFSQGAILSYAIALSHPEISKVIALSGY
jgi:phospholipase/carboxylesterase